MFFIMFFVITKRYCVSFHSEGPGELGLRAGDIINNVEQLDSEWYLGTSKGLTGFFPINYTKILVRNELDVHAGKGCDDTALMIDRFCLSAVQTACACACACACSNSESQVRHLVLSLGA